MASVSTAPPVPKNREKQRAAALSHEARYREQKVIDIRDLSAAERALVHALIDTARSRRVKEPLDAEEAGDA